MAKVSKKACSTSAKVLGSRGGKITQGKKPKISKKNASPYGKTLSKCKSK